VPWTKTERAATRSTWGSRYGGPISSLTDS
jgi:hypothetical protein